MKKFLLFIAIIAISFLATSNTSAQTGTKMTVASADTLTNADTTSKVIKITGGFASLAIQPVVTKLSGTAAGSVTLYGSIDGVNYTIIGSALSLSNVTTNTVNWNIGVPSYVYYKVVAISSGTVSEVLNVWYVLRKYQTQTF